VSTRGCQPISSPLAFAEGLFLFRVKASLSSEVYKSIHFYGALTEFNVKDYLLFYMLLYPQELVLPVLSFTKR